MNPLDFLAVVLPSPQHGYYCVAGLSATKKTHVFKESIDELEAPIPQWQADKRETYFALATFEREGSREATNARYIRSFFIDMDGYASKKEALITLQGFLDRTGLAELGTPWAVGSGGGVHCYWPLREELPISVWKPVAERLKALCAQEKLRIDMTVTADAARVLRLPNTLNFKAKYATPRPVKLLIEGDTFDFGAICRAIDAHLVTPPPSAGTALILPGNRPKGAPVAADSSMALAIANNETSFKKILDTALSGSGCGQLAHYREHASEDGMEPLWRGWLSIAKVCVDGEKAARWLSKQHPYDEPRMVAKLREIKGPYPCIKFDSENPGICGSCQHFGKITNPLALGRKVKVDNAEKEIEVVLKSDSPAVSDEIIKVVRPEAPYGFAYGANGGVYREEKGADALGNPVLTLKMLLPYDMFVVDILNSQGVHTVHMLAIKPKEGPLTVTIPQKTVVSKDDTVKALAEQNVIAAQGPGNDQNLFAYVRAAVGQASEEKVPVAVPTSYGWQADDTFVFSGRIYSTEAPVTVPMPGLENITANTKTTGSIDGWREFVKLLIRKKMYAHLAIMLAGASAPFMRFTGLYGMTYHCGSTESGTGKSLALESAASVWGHPVHYRTSKGTSPVAMQQRLGLLNSLPLITDEITAKNRNDFEWLAEFLLDMTEGRGKERMESGANKERLNLSTWMTVAILSSNTHVVDLLTGGRKHTSEGELRRLLEFTWTSVLKWEPEEIEIIKSLQQNYGVAGHMLAEYMTKNVDYLKQMVPETVRAMYKEYGATNDERFWMGGIGAAVAAGIVMNREHAGIVDLPMKAILDAFRELLVNMRDNVKGSLRTAEDVLNAYTRDNYGKMIVVRFDEKLKRVEAAFGHGAPVDESLTRTSVMGRVEHDITPHHIDYYIEESMLKGYCGAMGFGFSDFKRQLALQYAVTMCKKNMTGRSRGPVMRVNALKISVRMNEEDAAPRVVEET